MSDQSPSPPRFWIFQARRERYDLARQLVEGESETWELNQHKNVIRGGDVVFFWNSGSSENLHGWGSVEDVRVSASEVDVRCAHKFREALDRAHLQADPELASLIILRSPTGTNFRVTAAEAMALLIEIERAGETPPSAAWLRNDVYPLFSLANIRFKGVAERFRDAVYWSVQGAGSPIGADHFVLGICTFVSEYEPDVQPIRSFVEDALPALSKARELVGLVSHTEPPPPETDPSWDRPLIARQAAQLLERARRIAIATCGNEAVSTLHLAALLPLLEYSDDPEDRSLLAQIHQFVPDVRPFLPQVAAYLRQRDEDVDRWAAILPGLIEQPRATADSHKQAVGTQPQDSGDALDDSVQRRRSADQAIAELLTAGISDAPSARDFLDLEEEFAATARVLADPRTELPLAIGLFGHWGAGKTTFLDNVFRQIEKRNDPSNPGQGFYVCQVKLNAWHYMESDVWASFADHIFRCLDDEVRGRLEQQAELDNLLKKLEQESRLEQTLLKQIEKVDQDIDDAENALVKARVRTEEGEKALEQQAGNAIRALTSPQLQEELAALLERSSQTLGLKELENAARDIRTGSKEFGRLKGEVDALVARAKALESPGISERLPSSRYLLCFVGVLAVGGIVWKCGFGGDLTALLTLVGSGITLVKGAAEKLNSLGQVRLVADRMLATLKQYEDDAIRNDPEVNRLERELERARQEQSALQEQVALSTARKRQLESQLVTRPPGERILEFVQRRAESSDYNLKLGTLALVRRDFETLSRLLAEQPSHGNGDGEKLPSIRRIVLYIDDLDRCPRERVVQILEAVHLLLAFPLFAVVLAVDARWVERSVTGHIRVMRNAEGSDSDSATAPSDSGNGLDRGIATAQEFLEKIIQVPFWLKPLDPEKRSDFLSQLLQETKHGDESTENPDGDHPLGHATGESEHGADDSAGHASGSVSSEGARPGRDGNSGVSPESERDPERLPIEKPDEWDRYRLRSLTPQEQEFFPVLGPLLGETPRSVKRFLHLYHLCRAFRPDDTQEPEFLGEDGAHRGVQLLYAIVTGWPDLAFSFFDVLVANADADDFFELTQRLESNLNTPDSIEHRAFEGHDPDDVRRFISAFESARVHWEEIRPTKSTFVRVNPIVSWLPFVSRFAFDDWSSSRHAF